jgi:hypothetical protein
MSHHLTCPHCHCALRVPDQLFTPCLTCPSCAAIFPHPDAPEATELSANAPLADFVESGPTRGRWLRLLMWAFGCVYFCGGGCRVGKQMERAGRLETYVGNYQLEVALLALGALVGLAVLALGWWHLPRRRRAGELGVAERILLGLAVVFLTSASAFILFFTGCFGGVVSEIGRPLGR